MSKVWNVCKMFLLEKECSDIALEPQYTNNNNELLHDMSAEDQDDLLLKHYYRASALQQFKLFQGLQMIFTCTSNQLTRVQNVDLFDSFFFIQLSIMIITLKPEEFKCKEKCQGKIDLCPITDWDRCSTEFWNTCFSIANSVFLIIQSKILKC